MGKMVQTVWMVLLDRLVLWGLPGLQELRDRMVPMVPTGLLVPLVPLVQLARRVQLVILDPLVQLDLMVQTELMELQELLVQSVPRVLPGKMELMELPDLLGQPDQPDL